MSLLYRDFGGLSREGEGGGFCGLIGVCFGLFDTLGLSEYQFKPIHKMFVTIFDGWDMDKYRFSIEFTQ